ncbi:hypothetical protein FRC09_003178 [Ceratobasidium sp. 395]|nr:hypothetical protein FRC09_003178 [Ceratobasidium sp. 395]
MTSIVELGHRDVNDPFVKDMTISVGLIFSGVVEAEKIEKAWSTLGKAWPILGAHIRRNEERADAYAGEQTGKAEMVTPDPANLELKVTSQVLDRTLAETESIHTRTNTISTQVTIRTDFLYRAQPPQDLDQYFESGDPIFALHAAYLTDATFLTLTFPHLIDATGCQAVVLSFMRAMNGEPIAPLLSYDPWSLILPKALDAPTDHDALKPWCTWDAKSIEALTKGMEAEIRNNLPVQTRTIYFPANEIMRLKEEAILDLQKAGYEVPILSTTDIIGAWFYKHVFADLPDSDLKNRFVFPASVRGQFPDVFLPGQPYLRNAFVTISTDQLTDTELHSLSYGEIARIIRMSVKKCTSQSGTISKLKYSYEHAEEFHAPISPGDRVQGLAFKFGELNMGKHIKPGSGTGEIIDIGGEAIGRQFIALIKYKDADGGIVVEMDWGADRWTSGEMAKYAIENQA